MKLYGSSWNMSVLSSMICIICELKCTRILYAAALVEPNKPMTSAGAQMLAEILYW